MPAPFPQAKDGSVLKNSPTGFPGFFTKRQPRVVTADVWAFLRQAAVSALPRQDEKAALAFIEQAFEFFEAARNPRMGSRPLLYYYSFLNLAKAFLLIRKVTLAVAIQHGISDPKENVTRRLEFSGQKVRFVKCAHDHSHLFPEFVKGLGTEIHKPRELKVISMLRQIPGIHRTFCKVTGENPSFLPVKHFVLISHGGKIFSRMAVSKSDSDTKATLPVIRGRRAFRKAFSQVLCPKSDELWFESKEVAGIKRGIDTAIRKIATMVGNLGVWSILTAQGYRYYLCSIPPREMLPPLASIYAVMFYLGSITRYKPYDFDRIVSGRFSWLVGEFLSTQPTQFLYGLAGHVAGVDVVRPFATVD